MLSDNIIFIITITIMGVVLVILGASYFKYLIKLSGSIIFTCLPTHSIYLHFYDFFFFFALISWISESKKTQRSRTWEATEATRKRQESQGTHSAVGREADNG